MKRLLLCLLLIGGCASVPVKQQAVQTLSVAHAALMAADDAELVLYQAQSVPLLTDAKHQQISGLFVTAYDLDAKAARALIVWRAGDPMPQALPDYLAIAQEVSAEVAAFIPHETASSLVRHAGTWAASIGTVVAALGGL